MFGLLSYAQEISPRPAPGPLSAVQVPLDPARPQRTSLGALTYAGGLVLSAGASNSFGGLSGLVAEDGKAPGELTVTAVNDEGQIARFNALLDAAGRLTGAQNLTMAPLYEVGAPLGRSKARGDAEDIVRADGRYYLSFEVDNRVLAMADPFNPAASVARWPLPQAATALPTAEGLEAMAAAEIEDRPVLALGAEDGRIWLCPRIETAAQDCRSFVGKPRAGAFRLTALAHLNSGQFIALYRAFDPVRGWRARIEHLAPAEGGYRATLLAQLSPPMTVDNMEGLAVRSLPDGDGWRLYLLSDDNFRVEERTLLLAFDWRRRP